MKRIIKFIIVVLTLLLSVSTTYAYWVGPITEVEESQRVLIDIGEWILSIFNMDSWPPGDYKNQDGSFFVIPKDTLFIYNGQIYLTTKDFEPKRASNIGALIFFDPLNLYRGFKKV